MRARSSFVQEPERKTYTLSPLWIAGQVSSVATPAEPEQRGSATRDASLARVARVAVGPPMRKNIGTASVTGRAVSQEWSPHQLTRAVMESGIWGGRMWRRSLRMAV